MSSKPKGLSRFDSAVLAVNTAAQFNTKHQTKATTLLTQASDNGEDFLVTVVKAIDLASCGNKAAFILGTEKFKQLTGTSLEDVTLDEPEPVSKLAKLGPVTRNLTANISKPVRVVKERLRPNYATRYLFTNNSKEQPEPVETDTKETD